VPPAGLARHVRIVYEAPIHETNKIVSQCPQLCWSFT